MLYHHPAVFVELLPRLFNVAQRDLPTRETCGRVPVAQGLCLDDLLHGPDRISLLAASAQKL